MKKPKLPKTIKLPKLPARRSSAEARVEEALSSVPRITNETVAEHREAVLSSARKYIYPLQHSKHRIVRISVWLLAISFLMFFTYCGVGLYKFQLTTAFMSDVTRVIPFPVAKAGPAWVSYESYLFELRRSMHYYQTQQRANFSTPDGKVQLQRLKSQAMTEAVTTAYTKQLAAQNKVTVSSQEVDAEVQLVRSQNRLSSDRVFKDVLNEFWGWNTEDFKRELKQQLLQQKVAAKLDSATQQRANVVLQQLRGGADFAAVAAQSSDDASTRANGGQYPEAITSTDHNIAPHVTAELFKLQPGQISTIIDTGYTLEIVKVIDVNGGKVHAAHISFNYKDISAFVKPLTDAHSPRHFIKI
ncbi:MAG: peptidylprolyl isomerase [Candidatus Saccharibacteria bacterium]